MSKLHRNETRIGHKPLLLPTQEFNDSDSASRPKVLKRKIPVNGTQSSVDNKRLVIKTEINSGPRSVYHEFMTLDQGGFAIIASDNTKTCSLVAIKKRKSSDRLKFSCDKPIYHDNIVNLLDIFKVHDTVYMIYEQMDVSLRMINGIPHHAWKDHEIAAICKEESHHIFHPDISALIIVLNMQILNGMAFMHQELFLHHGKINCGTILMNREGFIKIGLIVPKIITNSIKS